MTQPAELQYLHQVKKGFTVMYGNKPYRVQEDRKYLHIVVFENGKRMKVAIDNLLFFKPGSKADYIFNGWFELYIEKEYLTYAAAELAWQNF